MRKSTRSFGARICALVIALWLIFAGVLTWAVAQDFQNQIYECAVSMMGSMSGRDYPSGGPATLPGTESLRQISHLGDPYLWLQTQPLLPFVLEQTPDSYGSSDWFWGDWELLYGFQPAIVFYDEAGTPLIKSGNLLSMNYITEECWMAQNTQTQAVAYIDLDKLPPGTAFPRLEHWSFPMGASLINMFSQVIRATGYFVGDEFVPVSADIAQDFELVPDDRFVETICRRDYQGYDQWERALTLEAPSQIPLVTIYIRETGGYSYEHTGVRVKGKDYVSLVDYAKDLDAPHKAGNLMESFFIISGSASENTGADSLRMAIRTKPLRFALLRLIPAYLVGSLLIGLCLWLLLRRICNQLTLPLSRISSFMDSGKPLEPCSSWEDVRAVEGYMRQSQDQLRSLQNENQQLRAALDYAKHAEENRRQLVSNITHELKTPLAVIHGYAEGLQAGIAEEKRDYYLRTILEESEKMDAMVLEMLDLSRLEAGKVHLSADHFSLRKLTWDILDKLAPEESRTHSISFRSADDCMITADEGRIAQVITNLISNALRYTPQDGCIWLQVNAAEGAAHFHITNHAEHLSEEVLEQIFDSFYRADASRSDKGTGLGLPIARSIIHLHGGVLTARNTWVNGEPCLEFAFELPLK